MLWAGVLYRDLCYSLQGALQRSSNVLATFSIFTDGGALYISIDCTTNKAANNISAYCVYPNTVS